MRGRTGLGRRIHTVLRQPGGGGGVGGGLQRDGGGEKQRLLERSPALPRRRHRSPSRQTPGRAQSADRPPKSVAAGRLPAARERPAALLEALRSRRRRRPFRQLEHDIFALVVVLVVVAREEKPRRSVTAVRSQSQMSVQTGSGIGQDVVDRIQRHAGTAAT